MPDTHAVFVNPLSSVSATNMYMSVRPSTGTWNAYKTLRPLTELNLFYLAAVNCQ